MKRYYLITAAVILVLSLLLISCGSNETTTAPAVTTTTSTSPASAATSTTPVKTTGAPKYGGILKLLSASISGPLGWPPNMVGPSSGLMQNSLQSLFRQNLDGTVTPWLATSYDIAPDRLSMTFHLRQGVKFHDGTDFNAEAVKFNFDAQIEAKKAPYWKSVEVLDASTVKVNLNSWNNVIIATFGDTTTGFIVSAEAVKKNGAKWAEQNPVGTGPFKFVSYLQDTKMVFTKFENYWEKGKPYIDGIEYTFTNDSLTGKNLFLAGEVYSRSVELGKSAYEMQQAGFELKLQRQATYCLIPDSANPDSPFSKPLVRQAVEYAINKEEIAEGLGFGLWKAPYQLPPSDNTAYNPGFSIIRKYDPAKAKQLLTEAGFPNGFKTTLVPGLAKNLDTAVAVQAYLNKVGIETELKDMDTAAYMQYRSGGSWKNALLIEPIATWSNYNQTMNYYFGPSSTQFQSWARSEQFIKDLNASLGTLEPDIKLMQKAADDLITECAVIPVHEGGASIAIWPFVKDAGYLERGYPVYWNSNNIWLDK